MKFQTIPLALAGLALMAPVLAQEATMETAPHMAQVVAERVAANQGRMGISAALLGGDETEFASAGVLRAGEAEQVNAGTLYEIGSVSKIFASLLLAQMVLEGKMDLDAPVADYLPEGVAVPSFEGRDITPFDLATHHSGLPSIPDDLLGADPANPYAAYKVDELYAFLARHELSAAPGAAFAYSNIGVTLLSLAISHVAGAPYDELVQSRILDPLGMDDTMLVVPEDDLSRFASPHDINGDPIPAWDFDVFAAAGGYRSSARDMAKFVAAASGRVETPLKEAFALMLERTVPAGSSGISIGLGWMISAVPGGDVVWHNGVTGGSNSFAGYRRDGSVASVVLANRLTPTGIEDIGFNLIDPGLPLRKGFGRELAEVDRSLYPDYAGTYPILPEFLLTVTTRDDRLFVQATNQPQYEVLPEGGDRFFYTVVDAQISFERDESGKVKGLVLHQNGQDMPAPKTE